MTSTTNENADRKKISTHTLTWSVTFCIKYANFPKTISTHTLTWSVTEKYFGVNVIATISTHTLTWSVTGIAFASNADGAFQLTRSRGA